MVYITIYVNENITCNKWKPKNILSFSKTHSSLRGVARGERWETVYPSIENTQGHDNRLRVWREGMWRNVFFLVLLLNIGITFKDGDFRYWVSYFKICCRFLCSLFFHLHSYLLIQFFFFLPSWYEIDNFMTIFHIKCIGIWAELIKILFHWK